MRIPALAVSLALSVSIVALTGCSLSPAGKLTSTSSAVTIHGTVHGGQQPVVGAHIYVMTPNNPSLGPGSASLFMLNGNVLTSEPANSGFDGNDNYYVTTAADGSFSINFGTDYDCGDAYDQGQAQAGGADDFNLPTDEPVYLYAVGGDAGAGSNSAAGFLASLGPCNGLSNSSTVQMNEITTVAMAYAAAGYASDATDIDRDDDGLAPTGLANAFANTTNLVDLPSGTALATTPTINGGNGTVPTAEITTLANILGACVNSADQVDSHGAFVSYSPACNQLFTTATSNGTVSGTSPTDTATAAINIAHNPGANVMTLYDLPNGTTAFGGGLTNQPNDFTIALLFTGGGFTFTSGSEPHALAIDGGGNAWAVSSVLTEFTPLGAATGYGSAQGVNVSTGYQGVAVTADSTALWIADHDSGTVINFSVSGGGFAYNPSSTPSGPADVAIDGSGNLYVADVDNSRLIELTSGGSPVGSPATGNGLQYPVSVAIQPGSAGNIWVANNQASDASIFTNNGGSAPTPLSTDTSGSLDHPLGSAIDSSGFVWMANLLANFVSKLDSGGTTGAAFTIPGATPNPDAVAIDGGGNAWVTDEGDSTLVELNNAGTVLSGTTGYPPVNGDDPDAVAVDGSGDVWYTSQSSNIVYEVIGAAVPVVTPIAYAVANGILGTQP